MGLPHMLLARPLMAIMDSEKAHGRALLALRITSATGLGRLMLRVLYRPKAVPSECFSMQFPNPLGLAAGMEDRKSVV